MYDIEHIFSYHSPHDDDIVRMQQLRKKAKDLAFYIEEHAPPSLEKSLAFTNLEQVVMWANASIVRFSNGPA